MRIVATVYDGAMAVNIGGAVESQSAIIEIDDDCVPTIVKAYLENAEWAKGREGRYTYQALSFSLLKE